MSLTKISTLSEKIRNIATAFVTCIAAAGILTIPLGYYAKAEVQSLVDEYFEKKYDASFKGLDQRSKEIEKQQQDLNFKLRQYRNDFDRERQINKERHEDLKKRFDGLDQKLDRYFSR